MIRAAVDARKDKMSILKAVTVLTSSNDETLRETGVSDKIDIQVLRLARLGVENGVDGIVASPHEIKMLRAEFGDEIKIVVPGVRPNWAESNDQKRTMTPREAVQAGADYLVIGRSRSLVQASESGGSVGENHSGKLPNKRQCRFSMR